MKKAFLILINLLSLFALYAQEKPIIVFQSKEEGYSTFRIPAIIQLRNGDLIAFAEGRLNNGADFGHVNIVTKSSKDKGKTWVNFRVVATNGILQTGNPAPVVDMEDPRYPDGRIFLFYNTGNASEQEIRQKKGIRETWYITSLDNGNTWSNPVNITNEVSKINRPAINSQWNHVEDWRSYANTPGHAIQIKKGKYKGRLYIAANHSEGVPQKDFKDYVAHGFYSDDHGNSFRISENNPFLGSNESTAAELSDGRIMMNSRNQQGNTLRRIVAISNDGGVHWDSTYFDNHLPDPICEGSLLTVQYKEKNNVLAFVNCASTTKRDSLTLRISYDDGKTWKKSILINAGDAAYSDVVVLSKDELGILYETDDYTKIVFVKEKWTE